MITKENAVIYQIYPKSFQDSNGDGIGDIRGIIQRLDYIKSLEINMIWITPIFVSPMNDNGYDVADYQAINPLFGTMEDFDELIEESQKRNIGIMLDMVFNHTSTQHAWFQEAIKGNKEYQDYYIFSDKKTNWKSKFGGSSWEYVPELNKYYLHLFDVSQADLNWKNPQLRRELYDVVEFWIAKGVKGFRFDVINLISKPDVFEDDYIGDGRVFYTDGPEIHKYLKEMNEETFGKHSDIITVGEMSSTNINDCSLYSNEDNSELSMIFSFHHLKVDYHQGNKWELDKFDPKKLYSMLVEWQVELTNKGGWNALFLNNHDQPRSVERFGNIDYHFESATAIATLMFMLKGTPFIYQGEELGIPNATFADLSYYRDIESLNYIEASTNILSEEKILNVLNQRSRDNGRTPMPWNYENHHGFSTVEPWLKHSQSNKLKSVEELETAEKSILNYYRKLIKYRNECPEIQSGKINFINSTDSNIFCYIRENESESYIIVTNLSNESCQYTIPSEYVEIILTNYEISEYEGVLKPYMTLIVKKIQ